MSHGWQIAPASTESTDHIGILAFAYFVALGRSLQRTKAGGWAQALAGKFASAPLAFATAGVPKMYVGAHYIDTRDKNTEDVLKAAIPTCDVVVITDFDNKVGASPTPDQTHMRSNAATSLYDFLCGGTTPFLKKHDYRHFLMHACRAVWNPHAMVDGSPIVAQGLYAYDDGFRLMLD